MSDEWVRCPGPAMDGTTCAGKDEQEAVTNPFDAVSKGVADGSVRTKDVEYLIEYYSSNEAFKLRNSRSLSWLQEVLQQLLQAPDVDSDSECDEQGVPNAEIADQLLQDMSDDGSDY